MRLSSIGDKHKTGSTEKGINLIKCIILIKCTQFHGPVQNSLLSNTEQYYPFRTPPNDSLGLGIWILLQANMSEVM